MSNLGLWLRKEGFLASSLENINELQPNVTGANHTTVNYVVVVEIVHCFKDLSYRLGSVLFCKLTILAYSVKELSTRGQLGDDIVLVLVDRLLVPQSLVMGMAEHTLDSNQS